MRDKKMACSPSPTADSHGTMRVGSRVRVGWEVVEAAGHRLLARPNRAPGWQAMAGAGGR
jgi:hypothetical protein